MDAGWIAFVAAKIFLVGAVGALIAAAIDSFKRHWRRSIFTLAGAAVLGLISLSIETIALNIGILAPTFIVGR